jgi:uncharacterized membrane protein YhaH (DUF805 family)
MRDDTLESVHPGIGRLYYFLARVMLILAIVFSVAFFGPDSAAFSIISLGAMIAGIVLDVMRLRNIGVSQWFVFLRYIPFVSLLFWIGLQSAPAGWSESRQLDRAGWAILGVHAALIVLIIFLSRTTGIEVFGLSFQP